MVRLPPNRREQQEPSSQHDPGKYKRRAAPPKTATLSGPCPGPSQPAPDDKYALRVGGKCLTTWQVCLLARKLASHSRAILSVFCLLSSSLGSRPSSANVLDSSHAAMLPVFFPSPSSATLPRLSVPSDVRRRRDPAQPAVHAGGADAARQQAQQAQQVKRLRGTTNGVPEGTLKGRACRWASQQARQGNKNGKGPKRGGGRDPPGR